MLFGQESKLQKELEMALAGIQEYDLKMEPITGKKGRPKSMSLLIPRLLKQSSQFRVHWPLRDFGDD